MEQQLRQVLQSTLNPNTSIRSEAEKQLEIVGKSPELMSIIQNVLMHDSDGRMKQIASIYFANALSKNWKEPAMAQFILKVQDDIMGLMSTDDRFPQQCYINVLQCIFENVEVGGIEHLFKKSPKYFNNASRADQIGVLRCVDGLLKSNSVRYKLETILPIIFNENGPIFIHHFRTALQTKDMEMSKICMKIIARTYSHYMLPEYLNRVPVFAEFFTLSLNILNIEVSQDVMQEKLRKWALCFLYKAINKACKKYFKNAELIDYVKSDENVARLIEGFFAIVEKFSAGQKFHPTALVHTCKFFTLLAQTKSLKPVIKMHYQHLLNKFILPAQAFDETLRGTFECDDEMYLRDRYNYVGNDIRSSTACLFSEILQVDKNIKIEVIRTLIGFLENTAVPNYGAYRYGIIGLLAGEQKALKKALGDPGYNDFLIKYIYADLNSKEGYLISQSLYFLSLAEECTLEISLAVGILKKVLEYMNADIDILPVEAALATSFFMGNPLLKDTMQNLVPSLLEKVIMFSKQHFLESLNTLLDTILDNYTETVAEFAPQFAASICTSIFEHLHTTDDSRISTICGFITTIDKLIMNADDQIEIVRKVYSAACKVIYTIFAEQISVFYQEALDLMNSFLFIIQEIDSDMLIIFNLVLSIDRENLSYYPREINDFVDNFLSYGKAAIVSNETLQKIYECIDTYISSDEHPDDLYEEDFEAGCRIADSLMLNAGATVHAMNQHIIPCIVHKMVVNYSAACDVTYLDVVSLETIMNCFLIAPTIVLNAMGKFVPTFFSDVAAKKSKFIRVHDKKMFILFVGELFKLEGTYPLDIANIVEAFVDIFYTLPEAIKKRNRMKEKEESYGDDEEIDVEEYDMEDDDYYDEDYDNLVEDIWFETDLDKFDAYMFVRHLLASPVPKSLGERAISMMTPPQVQKLQEILNMKQEDQK